MSVSHVADMADTIHDNVGSLPHGLAYVGGYVSGTPDIQWTANDWAQFTGIHVRNYQGYGPVPDLHLFDELDVENGALSPASAANIVRDRVNAGIQWTTIYGSDGALAATASAVQAFGNSIWNGHVNCRLANWDLNRDQAAAILGSLVHGMSCVGVQWASPSSNPGTILPGTNLTLSRANADLSVVDASWVPNSTSTLYALLLSQLQVNPVAGSLRTVQSTDGGSTWH